MELKDRQAKHPGRIVLVDVATGAEKKYDVILADEPTVAGTPLNAQTLKAFKEEIVAEAASKIKPSVSYQTVIVNQNGNDIY